ncbi:MAG: hypothetical protein LBQ45_02120 [Mycoplasmataceae bacterium]|jgi:hypothetical protein|nr:hypothetical protein [Mycoplasmataceae bacterium]
MKHYSIEELKNLSDSEWEAYRGELWAQQREKYSKPAPNFYLKNKDQYVNFLKEQKVKNEATNKPFTIDINHIVEMSEAQWENYRQSQWAKKGAAYQTDEVPEWFGKKDAYISFLVKNRK